MTECRKFTAREFSLVRSGLRRLRAVYASRLRADERKGWLPDPGKQNANAVHLAEVDELLTRFPYPSNTNGSRTMEGDL